MSVYMFDVDNTLCVTEGTDYEHSVPIKPVIEKINKLFDAGHTIRIFTGRGSFSGKNWRELTERQLKEWGVKYHTLFMGKPRYHYWIDDLCINVRDFMKS